MSASSKNYFQERKHETAKTVPFRLTHFSSKLLTGFRVFFRKSSWTFFFLFSDLFSYFIEVDGRRICCCLLDDNRPLLVFDSERLFHVAVLCVFTNNVFELLVRNQIIIQGFRNGRVDRLALGDSSGVNLGVFVDFFLHFPVKSRQTDRHAAAGESKRSHGDAGNGADSCHGRGDGPAGQNGGGRAETGDGPVNYLVGFLYFLNTTR